jgi:hypothetical protein
MATKRDSGKKGGLVTLERYGKDQLRTWGKLGGRPRDKSYDEIRQQRRLERNNNKEGMGPPGGNLRTLKTLYKLSQRSTDGENEQAGLADETPQEQVPAGKEAR